MIDRVLRELTAEDIAKISETYHHWQKDDGYEDHAGYCKSATLEEVASHGYVLTPGRYVGQPMSKMTVNPSTEDGEAYNTACRATERVSSA